MIKTLLFLFFKRVFRMEGEFESIFPIEILEKIFIHLSEHSLLKLKQFQEFSFLLEVPFWRRKAFYEYSIPAWYFDLDLQNFFTESPVVRYFKVGRKVRTSLTALEVLDKDVVLRDLYLRENFELFFEISKLLPQHSQKVLKSIQPSDFSYFQTEWDERLLNFCGQNKRMFLMCHKYVHACCSLNSYTEIRQRIEVNKIPIVYYFFPLISLRGKWGHAFAEAGSKFLLDDYQLFEDLLVSITIRSEEAFPFKLLEIFAERFHPTNLRRVLEFAYKYGRAKIVEAVEATQQYEMLSLGLISQCICWGVEHITRPLEHYELSKKVLEMAKTKFNQTGKGLYQIRRLKNHPLAAFLKVKDRDILCLFLQSKVFSLELLRDSIFDREIYAVGQLVVSYLEREGNVKRLLKMIELPENSELRTYLVQVYSTWRESRK